MNFVPLPRCFVSIFRLFALIFCLILILIVLLICQSYIIAFPSRKYHLLMSVIKELNSSSSALDGIDARYIKLASYVLKYPLADLFNLSLSTCELPAIWKQSHITSKVVTALILTITDLFQLFVLLLKFLKN